MSKFLNIITRNGDGALRARGEQLNTQTEIAQQTLINNLKIQKSELELKLQGLMDLSPDSKDSLRPGVAKGWNPNDFVQAVQKIKIAIYEKTIELKIAKETMKDLFDDEDAGTSVTDVTPVVED